MAAAPNQRGGASYACEDKSMEGRRTETAVENTDKTTGEKPLNGLLAARSAAVRQGPFRMRMRAALAV